MMTPHLTQNAIHPGRYAFNFVHRPAVREATGPSESYAGPTAVAEVAQAPRPATAATVDALDPWLTAGEIADKCRQAAADGADSVMVASGSVATAAQALDGSETRVNCAVGFPLGATPSTVKAFETARAVEAGAQKVTMGLNLGALRDGNLADVRKDFDAVKAAAGEVPVSVFLPTDVATPQERKAIRHLAERLDIGVVEGDSNTKRKSFSVPKPVGEQAPFIDRAVAERFTVGDILAKIDNTTLKPEETLANIKERCANAKRLGNASVCVNPYRVAAVAAELSGSVVKTCAVVGFPWGGNDSRVKAFETARAVADGADEIDMVVNIGALRGGEHDKVEADIRAVVEAAGGKTVKVILETSMLSKEELTEASKLSEKAGAHFVKTATGFGPGGATVADLADMRSAVGPEIQVKASGGVRDLHDALAVIGAGADRIGASSLVNSLQDLDPGMVLSPEVVALAGRGGAGGY